MEINGQVAFSRSVNTERWEGSWGGQLGQGHCHSPQDGFPSVSPRSTLLTGSRGWIAFFTTNCGPDCPLPGGERLFAQMKYKRQVNSGTNNSSELWEQTCPVSDVKGRTESKTRGQPSPGCWGAPQWARMVHSRVIMTVSHGPRTPRSEVPKSPYSIFALRMTTRNNYTGYNQTSA